MFAYGALVTCREARAARHLARGALRAARRAQLIIIRAGSAIEAIVLARCRLVFADDALVARRKARAARHLAHGTIRAARRASLIAIRAGFAVEAIVLAGCRLVFAYDALIARRKARAARHLAHGTIQAARSAGVTVCSACAIQTR